MPSESLTEVWVAQTWEAHGYGHGVQGVYESREAAFEALKELPNMTVWTDDSADGFVHGRPRKARPPWRPDSGLAWLPERWAIAKPMKVLPRKVKNA